MADLPLRARDSQCLAFRKSKAWMDKLARDGNNTGTPQIYRRLAIFLVASGTAASRNK